MPTVRELGQRVKAKYPEYGDIPDVDLGRRVKAKYPEYSDFTDEPDQPTVVMPPVGDTGVDPGIAATEALKAWTTPIPKLFGASTATELYDKATSAIKNRFEQLPPQVKERPDYKAVMDVGKYASRVGQAVPEVIDFATSGAGIATTAALGPTAAVMPRATGTAMSASMAPAAVKSVKNAVKNPTPESLGTATKDVLLAAVPTALMRKGKTAPKSAEAAPKSAEAGSITIRGSQPKKPIEEEFLNFRRVKMSPEEEQFARTTIREMAERGELVKDVEPHVAIREVAETLDPALVKEMAVGEGIQSRAARLTLRERANALNREAVDLGNKLKDPALSAEERQPLIDRQNRIENDVKEYWGIVSGIRTEHGRNLASLRMTADNTLDLGWWLGEAKRSSGLPPGAELPEKAFTSVRTKVAAAQEAEAAGDAAATAAAKRDLADTVAKLRTNGWLETSVAMRNAGLLTGVRTQGVNIGGTAGFQVAEELARVPAALADMAISLKTGKRTVAGADTVALFNSGVEAATRGISEAKEILRTGGSQSDIAKGDRRREWNFQGLNELADKAPNEMAKQVLGFSNDLVNKYVNYPHRTLSAEDKVFKVFALRRALEAEARVKAMNEASAGTIPQSQIQQRQAELVAAPTEQMTAEAIAYADFATFNNENSAATAISRGMTVLGEPGRAVVNMVLPYRRTPFNVFNRMLDYTPVGMVMRPAITAYESSKAGKAFPAQKTISEAFGRGMVGTGMLAMGWYLGKAGLAAYSEQEPGQRNVAKAAGRQAGSIRLGDDWWRTAKLMPGGTLLQIGSDLYHEYSRTLKNPTRRPENVLMSAGKALMEQPMMASMRNVVEAAENPGARGRGLVSSMAGSFVPTIVSDIAQAMHSERPEFLPPRDEGMVGAALHGVKSRLPYFRGTLPSATDVFGEKVESRRTNSINPLTPSKAKELFDPLIKMLVDSEIGIGSITPKPGEPDAEFQARKNLRGAMLKRALMQALPDLPQDREQRANEVRRISTAVTKQLTDELSETSSWTPAERLQSMREALQRIQSQ